MPRKTKSQKKQADRRRIEALQSAPVVSEVKQTIMTPAPKPKTETKVEKAAQYEESTYDLETKKTTWKDLIRTCVIIAALLGIQSYIFFIK